MRPVRDPGGVTFCIPNWNHRNFLARSIATAVATARELARLGAGCEILVIDDASRDGSQRFLLGLAAADPAGLVDVVIAPRNRGLAASRNLGTAHARYRSICFMDADNQLIPETFPLFWRAVKETGATMVYGNLLRHHRGEVEGLMSNDVIDDACLEVNYVDAFAIYDADRLERIGGFNESMTSHEDWEMILHILADDEDVVFVPVCFGYYHVVPHSMVKTEAFDHSRMHRIFNQRRSGFPGLRSRRRMYHPDIGWLIGGDDGAGS